MQRLQLFKSKARVVRPNETLQKRKLGFQSSCIRRLSLIPWATSLLVDLTHYILPLLDSVHIGHLVYTMGEASIRISVLYNAQKLCSSQLILDISASWLSR